jgi:hypothetical protein
MELTNYFETQQSNKNVSNLSELLKLTDGDKRF